MDKFKAFLKNKKVDKHFKKTGTGAKLSDTRENAPTAVLGTAQGGSGQGVDRVLAADIAAQAALKRLYKEEPKVSYSQKKIQMIAQRELDEERRKAALEGDPDAMAKEVEKMGIEAPNQPDIREFEHSDVIKGVYYTCDLLGDDVAMTKAELSGVIEEFLLEQLKNSNEDGIIPSVLMIYSLNKKEARQLCTDTIGKYVQNIAENPDEPKYRRIRLSNKAFQERVQSVKGGREFLQAIGFRLKREPLKEGEPDEDFLVMPEQQAQDTGRLVAALESLREGQSVPLRVSRDSKVFVVDENSRVPLPKLPDDFFDLTAAEVKKEQLSKTADTAKLTALRTRDMRERDQLRTKYSYKYTLIRVRFPDRLVLQGTFGCYETVGAVREWVHKHVAHEAIPFQLRDSVNGAVLDDDSAQLADVKLAPAAVIHLDWQEAVQGPSLAEHHLAEAVPFVH